MPLLLVNPDKCGQCLNCVRSCPVQAIRLRVGQDSIEINDDRCIGCGACLKACPSGVINYHDSTVEVMRLLKSDGKVAAIVDPSISGEFPDITDYRKFVEMIRSLGFDFVNEVSFGVDLVAIAYRKLFSESKGKYYITTNCPAIVSYIRKFVPSLTGNLAPLITPMLASAKVVKQVYGDNVRVVYIGPCIDAKREINRIYDQSEVDEVLTFEELRRLFEQHNIMESQLEYSDFDPPIGRLGSLYPISTGILEAGDINQSLIDGTVITAEGNPQSLKAVKAFEKNIDGIKKHFNLFFNEGYVMGAGMTTHDDKLKRNAHVIEYAKKRLKDFDQKKWEQDIAAFADMNMKRTFKADDQRLPIPDEAKIQEVLKLTGKDQKNVMPNCGSCGFSSCRDFAIAVAQGLTRTDLCYDFAINSKNKYISTLRESNRKKLN